MKIVQVVAYYPPNIGGLQNCVKEISERLVEKGHIVEVFTSDIDCKNGKQKSSRNNKINYLKGWQFAHSAIIPSLLLRLALNVNNSIIHVHVAHVLIPEIVYLVSKIRNIPYIANIHSDVESSGKFGFLLKPYKKYILKYVLKNASRVVCATADQRKIIINKYKLIASKVVVIPDGVGEEHFIKRKKFVKRTPRILNVGRFDVIKNIPLLINSVSKMREDVILDLVGDGERRREIEKAIEEKKLKNVHMHGMRAKKEIISFYKNADVFVISSHKEGLSIAVLEAMAAGLPIIGTNVPGIRDLIKDVGILVPDNNPKKLAVAIDSLVSNKKLQKELSSKSLNAARKYKWNENVRKFEKIYKDVLEEKSNGDKQVIVTTSWDDGHILDLKLAKLLKKYGIKATFYIPPKNREILKKDLLSDDNIKSLSNDFEIGSHTMTHPRLTDVSKKEALKEIVESKKYLEDLIGKKINLFCYPGGEYNHEIKNLVKKAGFLGARTTKQMITCDPKDLFEIGTTIHDFPLSPRVVAGRIKHAIKNNIRLAPMLLTRDWARMAINTFDYVNKNGGIWHLWGHSWMVEKYKDWDKLEKVLSYVSRKNRVKYLTNSKTILEFHQNKLGKKSYKK